MNRFEKILCVCDHPDALARPLARAVELAIENQAALTVIDLVEPRPGGWTAFEPTWPAEAYKVDRADRLERAIAPFRERVEIVTRTASGVPHLAIVREVLRGGHDLVVRESEDPDWLDRVIGSDDLQLLRQCPCPVWLIEPTAARGCRRILAAVDVDEHHPERERATRHALNRRILDLACSIAIAESAELHVVHAWHALSSAYPGIPAELLTEYIERTRDEHRTAFATLLAESAEAIGADAAGLIERHEHLVDGHARREIPRLAKRLDADLVVMGSVARTGVPGLLVGNTAESILGQLERSVLVVKPPGFLTPVTATA